VDLITHVAAGALCGGCVALMIQGVRAKVAAGMSWGALGGFLPDIDAATRVPGFDESIGQALGLQPGAVIYVGDSWYSHHHFTHSLAAAGAAALLLALALAVERAIFGAGAEGRRNVRILLAPACVLGGFLLHLAGDLPTPASVWGGIQLFWPSETMVGGWGWAWWFNNYDVFLVQLAGWLLLGLASLVPRGRPVLARVLPAWVLVLVVTASAVLLRLREHDYGYSGHAADYNALEQASMTEQRRLLPAPIYEAMARLDASIPLPF
jgi:inner membrane protein